MNTWLEALFFVMQLLAVVAVVMIPLCWIADKIVDPWVQRRYQRKLKCGDHFHIP